MAREVLGRYAELSIGGTDGESSSGAILYRPPEMFVPDDVVDKSVPVVDVYSVVHGEEFCQRYSLLGRYLCGEFPGTGSSAVMDHLRRGDGDDFRSIWFAFDSDGWTPDERSEALHSFVEDCLSGVVRSDRGNAMAEIPLEYGKAYFSESKGTAVELLPENLDLGYLLKVLGPSVYTDRDVGSIVSRIAEGYIAARIFGHGEGHTGFASGYGASDGIVMLGGRRFLRHQLKVERKNPERDDKAMYYVSGPDIALEHFREKNYGEVMSLLDADLGVLQELVDSRNPDKVFGKVCDRLGFDRSLLSKPVDEWPVEMGRLADYPLDIFVSDTKNLLEAERDALLEKLRLVARLDGRHYAPLLHVPSWDEGRSLLHEADLAIRYIGYCLDDPEVLEDSVNGKGFAGFFPDGPDHASGNATIDRDKLVSDLMNYRKRFCAVLRDFNRQGVVAGHTLVKACSPLIDASVQQYVLHGGISPAELHSEAVCEVLYDALAYNFAYGNRNGHSVIVCRNRFMDFAANSLEHAMPRIVSKLHASRGGPDVSQQAQRDVNALRRAMCDFGCESGRECFSQADDIGVVAERLGWTAERVCDARILLENSSVSLDALVLAGDGKSRLADFVVDPSEAVEGSAFLSGITSDERQEYARRVVDDCLACLEPDERKIIGIVAAGKSFSSPDFAYVADNAGMEKEDARAVYDRALAKLKGFDSMHDAAFAFSLPAYTLAERAALSYADTDFGCADKFSVVAQKCGIDVDDVRRAYRKECIRLFYDGGRGADGKSYYVSMPVPEIARKLHLSEAMVEDAVKMNAAVGDNVPAGDGVKLFVASRLTADHDYSICMRRQRITDGERSNVIRNGRTPFAASYRDRKKNVAVASQCICSALRSVRNDMLDAVLGVGREKPGILFTKRGSDGFWRSGYGGADAAAFRDYFFASVYCAGDSTGNGYTRKLAAVKKWGDVIYESVRGISGMPDAEAERERQEGLRDAAAERECGRIVRKAVDDVFSTAHMSPGQVFMLKPAMVSALREIAGIKWLGSEKNVREAVFVKRGESDMER